MDRPITKQQAEYDRQQAERSAAVTQSFNDFQKRESTGGGFSNTPADRWLIQNNEFNRGVR